MNKKRMDYLAGAGIFFFPICITLYGLYAEWIIHKNWLIPLSFSLLVSITLLLFFGRHLFENQTKKPRPDTHEKIAQLKTWVIPLYNFRFHHEPYRRESSQINFIGRDDLTAEFLALLNNSHNSSGSYLVTGYRGVGKTSLVKKVLHDYADGRHHLNLSEKYDIFGHLILRVWHRFICWWGKCLLSLHKRLSGKTKDWRDKGRPAPSFIYAWNLETYSLYLVTAIPWLLIVSALSILFFSEPGDGVGKKLSLNSYSFLSIPASTVL
jgi:hypothetical protein